MKITPLSSTVYSEYEESSKERVHFPNEIEELNLSPTLDKRSRRDHVEKIDGFYLKPKRDNKLNPKGGDDLFACIKVPLLIGTCLGLIPVRGLMESHFDIKKQTFSWCHYRTFISILVTSLIFLNTIFISHSFLFVLWNEHNSAGKLVLSFSGVWFYTAGTLVYLFFLLRSKQLCEYFNTWVKVSSEVAETLTPDWTICRDVNLICLIVFFDCLGENTMYHFHAEAMQPEKQGRMGNMTFEKVLKDYYDSNQYIFPFFDYNPLIALALLVTNKLTTYAWNFGDVFLMVVFRVLSSRYDSLNRFLESLMVPDGSVALIKMGTISWRNIRRNFLLLTSLLEEGNKLLSPLIWLSYITDIFFVCRQLYESLSPNSPERWMINKVYLAWSLLHLIIRTVGVNLMAAKINENAHRISKLLQHCHSQEYDDNVGRLERFLGSKIIGITGNGCFIISRSFILMNLFNRLWTILTMGLKYNDIIMSSGSKFDNEKGDEYRQMDFTGVMHGKLIQLHEKNDTRQKNKLSDTIFNLFTLLVSPPLIINVNPIDL